MDRTGGGVRDTAVVLDPLATVSGQDGGPYRRFASSGEYVAAAFAGAVEAAGGAAGGA
ncbi:hypothetical protein [Streptomyces sp. NPDC002962]|uniref:hypothetical protein n=1 Tax=Streptomyces sp. NPDC002962 TaxID=3364674 RepID=UPI0036A0C409